MIERDLNVYLDKVDYYTNQSVELFEQALRLYGLYTDNTRLESDFVINLSKLSESYRTLYFEISDYTIDDLAPDPFQDMDTSFHSFISICDNLLIYLLKLTEPDGGNHWLIKKTVEDCQKDYKKLFKFRNHPEIVALSKCRLSMSLKNDLNSRVFDSISQKLIESQITCTELWLSGETNSTQLNIELLTGSAERQDLLDLALRCIHVIKEDLSILNHAKIIFISFRTIDRLHCGWVRGSKDSILSFISEERSSENFEKLLFIYYSGDIVIAAQKLADLAEHSSSLNKDYEVKGVLIEAVKQLEVLVKRAVSDSDPIIDLTLKYSFQHALLDCMLILLKVVSVTKDQEVAEKFIYLFSMFRRPEEIDTAKDYAKLFYDIGNLIEVLKLRYVIIPNTRKVSLGAEINPLPRIAIVQPRIWFDKEYNEYKLAKGLKKHIEIFKENIEKASQQSANVIVFPEMFFPASQISELRNISKDKNMIIITGLDYEYDEFNNPINSCAIVLPNGNLIKQQKLYRSKYDSPNMICGKELFVFTETPIGNFSVFICFDYLSPRDLMKFRGVIDTLFVITLNPDVRAYNECAKADAYRSLYGFIIIVNAFDPYSTTRLKGKSGFYGPLRKNRSIAEFEEKKYGIMIEDLPLNELNRAKRGEESSTMKSLPANFEVIDLARDYPEKEIGEIQDRILQEIKENKRNAAREPKTDYEILLKGNRSQDLERDIKKHGYAIMVLEPVHNRAATRLSAFLLINKGISKKEIKSIIRTATEDIRKRECYSNEIQEARHKGKLADVVWLYIFNERRHRRHLVASDFYDYYVCRTQWISPKLDKHFTPMPLICNDKIDDIQIQWNKNYSD